MHCVWCPVVSKVRYAYLRVARRRGFLRRLHHGNGNGKMNAFLQSVFGGWIAIAAGQIVWIECLGQTFSPELFGVLMIGALLSSFLIAAATESNASRRLTLKKIRARERRIDLRFASLESREFHGFTQTHGVIRK